MNYTQLITEIQSYTENQFASEDLNTFIRQAEQRVYNTVQFPSLRRNVIGATYGGNKYLSAPGDFLAVYSIAVIDGDGNYEYLLNKDVNFIRAAYPSPNDTGIPQYYALFGPTTTNTLAITNELSFLLGPTPDDAYDVELHYYYYPESIVQGVITGWQASFSGSGLSPGTYYGVPFETDGQGSGGTANITVANGTVSEISIVSGGNYYAIGDSLTTPIANIGGTGTTFQASVTSVSNANGTTWLGDNFDSVLLYGSLLEAYTYMKGESDVYTAYQQRYNEALAMAKRLGDGMERGDAYRDGQYKQKVV